MTANNAAVAVAMHEAGHALVGLALGLDFDSIWSDGTTGAVEFGHGAGLAGLSNAAYVAYLRQLLAVDVAGMVAEDLYHIKCQRGHFRPRTQQIVKAGTTGAPARLSALLDHCRCESLGLGHLDFGSDPARALRKARTICFFENGRLEPPLAQAVIAELEMAEQRAEELLVLAWADVCQVADALAQGQGLRLSMAATLQLIAA